MNTNMDTNNPNDENIEFTYTYYTEQCRKHLTEEIGILKSRSATFLGFAGLLLRFIIELSDSQPSYKLTKIFAFITCFCAIFLLGLTLSSHPKIDFTTYKDRINNNKDVFLQTPLSIIKIILIENDIEVCEELFTKANKTKNLLNTSIFCLVFSAFFFTVNGVLVSCLGE